MERRSPPLSEQSYVTKTISETVGLLKEDQPAHTYPGDWYKAVQRRNSVYRISQEYEEARSQGFEWAEYLNPGRLHSNWSQLIQFASNIDKIRSEFIQRCNEKLSYFEQLANHFQLQDSGLSSDLRAAIKNIEQTRDQYVEPLTTRKAIVRQ